MLGFQNVPKGAARAAGLKRIQRDLVDLCSVLTGPQLYSPSVFAVGLVASIVLRLLGTPNSATGPLYLQLIDGSIGFIVLWIWILLVTRCLVRGKHPKPVLAVASVLVGAAIRGAVIHLIISTHSSEPAEPIWYRLASSLILVSASVLTSSYVLHQVTGQLARLGDLSATRQALSSSLQNANKLLEFWFENLLSKTQSDLQSQWEKGRRQTGNGVLSQRMKEFVLNSLRPVSRNLSEGVQLPPLASGSIKPQSLTLKNLTLAVTYQGLRNRPIWTSLFIATAALPSVLLFDLGPLIVLWVALFIVLYSVALDMVNRIFAILESRLPRSTRLAVFILLTYSVTFPAANYSLVAIGFASKRPDYMLQANLLMSCGITMAAVSIALVAATRRASAQLADELKLAIDNLKWRLARVKAQMWQRQQFLARALHGPVQAIFTAYAIRLDMSQASTDSKATRRQLETEGEREASDTLQNIRRFIADEVDFEAALNQAIEHWVGICEIELEFSPTAKSALEADSFAARATLDMIQDGLSNSVRHGRATSVRLRISDNFQGVDPVIAVSIIDSGLGLGPEPKPGFGSQQLDALTTGWTLRNLDSGVELQFSVPVALQPLLG
jgi:signal transduction histidine kinase